MRHPIARQSETLSNGGARRAFTLIELLAVIGLLAVVLGIAVPAFRGMLNASELSSAENSLRVGVTVARDLALRGDGDAALVVIRDPDGRTRLVPAVHVGTVLDSVENPFVAGSFNPIDDPGIRRDVFAPIPLASPLEMPGAWSVAGFAAPNTVDRVLSTADGTFEGWYDSAAYGDNGSMSTDAEDARLEGNWVLPETWLFERVMQAPGATPPSGYSPLVTGAENANRTPRQSFMIRFESGTGLLARSDRPALVVDARPSSLGRGDLPVEMRWAKADRMEDARDWTRRVLETTDIDGDGASPFLDPLARTRDETLRVVTIGNYSNDTVLAGSVSRVALFREDQLAQDLEVGRYDREQDWLYSSLEDAGRMEFNLALFDANSTLFQDQGDVRVGINRWIQGDTNFIEAGSFDGSDGDGDGNIYGDQEDSLSADQPRARIFFIHSATGDLQEVQR